MSRKQWIEFILLVFCLVTVIFCMTAFQGITGTLLGGQQDAPRDEWIEGSALANAKYAYLTFDDGPSDRTDEILDVLKEKNVKATFFVVGKEGEKAKERYRRIVKEGHTLGLHSYSHDYKTIYCSVGAFAKDITKLDHYLYEITDRHPTALRFPGGSSNSIVSDIRPYINWVKQQNYEYYDWNAQSNDAVQSGLSAKCFNENILKDIHGQSTVIILMHDLSNNIHLTESLSELIDKLKMRGYELRAIDGQTKAIHHVSMEDGFEP